MSSSTVDWERVEADYRIGVRTLREIAAEHKITEGAVRKRAKRDGWVRDLGPKVRAKADDLVRKALVRSEVRKTTTPTEKQAIEVEAIVASRVRIGHQVTAKRLQALVLKLTTELERQTTKRAALKDRAGTAKSLIDAFGRLVAIEREAHGINADTDIDDPLAKLLHGLKARTIQPVADDPDHA